MENFLLKMKDLKLSDFVAGIKFLIAIIPSMIYKIYLKKKGRKFWLICEDATEAQDNGWCFFQFMNQEHPEVETLYAIKNTAPMYKKVCSVGKTVNYGSVLHWIYYLCAEVNISSQKGGKPNAAICYVLEIFGIIKNRRVFLQHGITMNDCNYLYFKNTKMWMFITAAMPEHRFVMERFGYPGSAVICAGFSRFDYLENNQRDKIILLMPSWRYWLKLPSKVNKELNKEYYDFESSEYFKVFQSLLKDKRLLELLDEYGFQLYFYPHRNIQRYLSSFCVGSNRVRIASCNEYDIQELFSISSIMITDYSSVSFDFAYLDKPILYYQFDVERFRKYQYGEGYFDYEKHGFGPVCYDNQTLLKSLEKIVLNEIDEMYSIRRKKFFAYHDKNNSKRIYEAINKKMEGENKRDKHIAR